MRKAIATAAVLAGFAGMAVLGAAAPASAGELPPYKCAVDLPLLQKEQPILLGGLFCEEKKEKPGEGNPTPPGPPVGY